MILTHGWNEIEKLEWHRKLINSKRTSAPGWQLRGFLNVSPPNLCTELTSPRCLLGWDKWLFRRFWCWWFAFKGICVAEGRRRFRGFVGDGMRSSFSLLDLVSSDSLDEVLFWSSGDPLGCGCTWWLFNLRLFRECLFIARFASIMVSSSVCPWKTMKWDSGSFSNG